MSLFKFMVKTRPVLLQKFKLIFAPFLIITISFLVVFTFIHWLILIKLHLFAIDEMYAEFWAPVILAVIAALTWLRTRIKLLRLKKDTKNATGLIQYTAVFAIAIPLVMTQMYLETGVGFLTRLGHVDEITKMPESKFYSISSYYVDTTGRGIAYTSNVSGKYNQSLDLHIYISCPLYDVDRQPTKIGAIETDSITKPKRDHRGTLILLDNYQIDSTKLENFPKDSIAAVKVLKGVAARRVFGEDGSDGVIMVRTKRAERNFYGHFLTDVLPAPKAWCCFKYYKEISNRKSAEEKKEAYHQFYDQSLLAFRHTDMGGFSYLQRTGYNDDLTGFKKAIRKTDLVVDSAIRNVLEPKFTNYEDRNGHKLAWIFGALAIGSVIWFGLLMIYPFDEDKLNSYLNGRPQKEPGDYKEIVILFKPRPGYYLTPILIDLNILIFLIMVVSGLGIVSVNTHDLLVWGANFRPKIIEGQWWRLFTNIFLHNGIVHLLANMCALLFVGMMLEPRLGTTRMMICYLVTGVCASLASVWWYHAAVSVGASGAIFGLYGVFLSLMLTRVYPKEVSKVFLLTMLVFIGFNLLVGINGGIDNAAHIGGLLSGLIVGLIISPGMLSRLSEETQ